MRAPTFILSEVHQAGPRRKEESGCSRNNECGGTRRGTPGVLLFGDTDSAVACNTYTRIISNLPRRRLFYKCSVRYDSYTPIGGLLISISLVVLAQFLLLLRYFSVWR